MKKYLSILTATFVVALAVALWPKNHECQGYMVPAPTKQQLNQSIAAAEHYYEGLYKSEGDKAVVSEYYSLPFNFYFQKENKVVLLGQNTTITKHWEDKTREGATITVEAPEQLKMTYTVTWAKDGATIDLMTSGAQNVMVLLGTRPLTVFWDKHQSASIHIPLTDLSEFQSNRYTVRHATSSGISYYKATDQPEQENSLLRFIESYGLPFGYDLHSVIWGDSAGWPADFVYNSNVYYDCYINFPSYQFAYPYKSKVCSVPNGVELFTQISKTDSLVPTMAAIQNVERGQVAQSLDEDRQLEKEFDTTGFGLSTCPKISILPPFYCSYNEESTIRTATFGVLEMKLGHWGYADKVASLLVSHQVKNGDVSLTMGHIYRPLQTGAVPLAWNQKGQFTSGESTIYKIVGMIFNMDVETRAPIITNAETQSDVLAFLTQYQCMKYKICD